MSRGKDRCDKLWKNKQQKNLKHNTTQRARNETLPRLHLSLLLTQGVASPSVPSLNYPSESELHPFLIMFYMMELTQSTQRQCKHPPAELLWEPIGNHVKIHTAWLQQEQDSALGFMASVSRCTEEAANGVSLGPLDHFWVVWFTAQWACFRS